MPKFTYGTTYCRSCGHDVGLHALMCPNCGNYRPGAWDLRAIKNTGLLILLVGLGIIGVFPILPILIGLLVGLGIPLAIVYAVLKAGGVTFGQYFGVDRQNESATQIQLGDAPYRCVRCNGGMWEEIGICPSCNYGAGQMVCSCGTQVAEPTEGAFRTTGVLCPVCNALLKT